MNLMNDRSKLPERLFHYTSLDGFLGIMGFNNDQSKELDFLCTHCNFLNDTNEFRFGLDKVQEWLAEKADKEVSKSIRNYVKRKATWKCSPWVFSFSEFCDATAMWMSYTDKGRGGYCIGFDASKLDSIVQQNHTKYAGMFGAPQNAGSTYGFFLDKCVYVNIVKNECDELRSLYERMFIAEPWFQELRGRNVDEYCRRCAGRLLRLAALVKDVSYDFENEWRIVHMPHLDDYLEGISIIGQKARILFRCDDPSCVKEVTASPNGNRDWLKNLAEAVKVKKQMRFQYKESNSSYNGR